MKPKAARQREILRAVARQAVATQAELREVLAARGHRVDQATLSRDIRELGLVKVAGEGGRYRYAPVEEISPILRRGSRAIVGRFARSVETSRNLLVVKTDPGNAPPLALALDRMGWSEVLGTVAGDDTILIVVREGVPARKVAAKLEEITR